MDALQYAESMETAVTKRLQELQINGVAELSAFFSLLLQSQISLTQFVATARRVDVATTHYPEPDLMVIIGSDTAWKKSVEVTLTPEQLSEALVCIWTASSLMEKSSQFYRQAGLNHAHPAERLLFSSLTEVKQMLRRRVNAFTQSLGNQVWSEVGFSPFVLAKE